MNLDEIKILLVVDMTVIHLQTISMYNWVNQQLHPESQNLNIIVGVYISNVI